MISRRSILFGPMIAGAGLALSGQTALSRDYWGERLAAGPSEFIFGYGTLINEPSRTSTSGHRVAAVPARISGAFGYVRAWVARSGTRSGGAGFTALGLRRLNAGEAPSSINGVVFPVMNTDEMAAFDRREGGYARVEVDPSLMETVGWQGLPKAGRVWIYVPRGSLGAVADNLKLPDADFPLLQSYIDVVLQGAIAEGADYARELIASSFDWSPYWLDDRPIPRRPWAGTAEAGPIDRLLASVEPAASQFANRLYPELYAARHLMGAGAGVRDSVGAR